MKKLLLLLCILLSATVVFPQTSTRKQTTKSHRVVKKATPTFNLVGKTYAGSGNTAGCGINLTITFLEGSKCKCTSDFYLAFTDPVTRMGTYTVTGSRVTVKVKPEDDYSLTWKFKIDEGGKKLWFNNTDPHIQGSMKNDFLYLDLQ